MKGKTCEGEWMEGDTKCEGAQDESKQARSPRSEEKWMPKEENNSESRRPKADEIYLYPRRGDRVR